MFVYIFRAMRWLVLGLSLVLMAATVWASLDWPVVHDAGVIRAITWRIMEGEHPYADVLDLNWPGSYLPFFLGESLGGSNATYRAIDLGLLAAVCAAIAYALRGYAREQQVTAAATFAAWHLSAMTFALQRELLIAGACVLGCAFLSKAHDRDDQGAARVVAAGLCFGLSLTVKPVAVPMICAVVLIMMQTQGHKWLRAGRMFLCGCSWPLMAMVLWLGVKGGLLAFVTDGWRAVAVHALVTGPDRSMQLLTSLPFRMGLIVGFVTTVLYLGQSMVRERTAYVQAVWTAASGAALVSFLLQGKGWIYQLHPLMAVLPVTLVFMEEREEQPWLRSTLTSVRLALLAFLASVGFSERRPEPKIMARVAMYEVLATDIATACPLDQSVGFVGMNDTPIALYKLRRLNVASRVVYETYLLNLQNEPWVRALRQEFLADMRQAGCVVISETGWPYHGYSRFMNFPEFQEVLADDFTLVIDRQSLTAEPEGHRIYVRTAVRNR